MLVCGCLEKGRSQSLKFLLELEKAILDSEKIRDNELERNPKDKENSTSIKYGKLMASIMVRIQSLCV